MSNYYNFNQTENAIYYEPYLYDKGNNNAHLFSGISLLIIGIVLSAFEILKEGIYFGILFGGILILNGLYRILVEGKTKLEFNRQEDALYKITPLRKSKKIALSNIYNIIIVSENGNYTYDITHKDNPNAISIEISSYLNEKRQSKKEFQFLEYKIIPSLKNFLFYDK